MLIVIDKSVELFTDTSAYTMSFFVFSLNLVKIKKLQQELDELNNNLNFYNNKIVFATKRKQIVETQIQKIKLQTVKIKKLLL